MQTKYWIAMFIGAMMSISFFAACENSGGKNDNDFLVMCPRCSHIFQANLHLAPAEEPPTTSPGSASASSVARFDVASLLVCNC